MTNTPDRRLRYSVAASLDGFIAGPKGELDWIVMDPSIDFSKLFDRFDTILMGRLTYEITSQGPMGLMPGMKTIVCSRTLISEDHPDVSVFADAVQAVSAIKNEPGKDIWIFGGGSLFRSLLDARLVDVVEVAIIPVMLGDGIPLLPAGDRSPSLIRTECSPLESGIVTLAFDVNYR